MKLLWIGLIVLGGFAAALVFTRMESDAPTIRGRSSVVHVGASHKHEWIVSDQGMGVSSVRVWLESGDQQIDLFQESYNGNSLMGASLRIARRVEVDFNPHDLGIEDGRANLAIEAADFSWSGNRARLDVPLVVDSRPPRVAVHSGLTYVRRGGAELVVYSVDDDSAKHGVQVGERFSPGYPHPIDPGRFMAFYPLPPETPPGSSPVVVAEDRAGNLTQVGVSISIIERTFPSDRVALSDGFLAR